MGIGQILALWGPPYLFATLGLVSAFLSVPAAAVVLVLSVALLLPEKAPETRRGSGHLRALLKERDFWLLLLGFAFIGMLAQVAVQTWMPTYLRRVHGFGVVAAGLSAGIVVTGLTVFSPIFGLLSDRLTARRPIMLAGSLLALLGWLVLLVTAHPWVAVVAALLVSASMAATIPMQALFASERFAAIGAGAAIGLVNAGSQIGASLGGPLHGVLLDRGWGFDAVWGLAAALGIVRIGALLCIRETRA